MQRRSESECACRVSSPGPKSARAWTATPMPLLLALIFALAGPSLYATTVSSDIPLGDYVHTVWTQHDGVPLGAIYRILQTADGYLWIFTREGLLRFDGMRFVSPSTHAAKDQGGESARRRIVGNLRCSVGSTYGARSVCPGIAEVSSATGRSCSCVPRRSSRETEDPRNSIHSVCIYSWIMLSPTKKALTL